MNESHSQRFITLARQFVIHEIYDKAFDLYLKIFQKFPSVRSHIEDEFRLLLNNYNETLDGNMTDIFKNFEQALTVYQNNKYILNDLGKYLYKFGFLKEACCHFQKALKADPGYVTAEKNLNNVKNLLVERWHFRMLNDRFRNDAYRDAIHKMLEREKCAILDIGSGSGVLAIYAKECQPKSITAIDSNEIMVDIANRVFLENNVEAISVINKLSTSLNSLDIGGRKSHIITELFDAGLLGEHILQTLIHAWEYLLEEAGTVTPQRAEFFIAGVNSKFLLKKYQLLPEAKTVLNINKLNVHVYSQDPYDSDDIHFIKDVVYVTDPQSLFKINFNCLEDLKKKLYQSVPYSTMLRAKLCDEVNILIGWFDLHLDDNIILTTNPTAKKQANAWQQAVFYDFIPILVKPNQSIPLQFTTSRGKLKLVLDNIHDIHRISDIMLRFLNDKQYQDEIVSSVPYACNKLSQNVKLTDVLVIDLAPFPLFGLLMLREGIKSLTCFAATEEDKNFINEVFSINNISQSKFSIIVEQNINEFSFPNKQFDIIFYNILDLCGDLNTDKFELLNFLKSEHLVSNGLVIPFKIDLEAQIISSDWLEVTNEICDENVHRYKIARFINKYQVSQNFHIDFTHLEYTALSNSKKLAVINETFSSEVISTPIIQDGDANGILCWFNIELIEGSTRFSTYRPNSFIDGTAFIMNPKVSMKCGEVGNILLCVDKDSCTFKLVIDTELYV